MDKGTVTDPPICQGSHEVAQVGLHATGIGWKVFADLQNFQGDFAAVLLPMSTAVVMA